MHKNDEFLQFWLERYMPPFIEPFWLSRAVHALGEQLLPVTSLPSVSIVSSLVVPAQQPADDRLPWTAHGPSSATERADCPPPSM